MSRIVLVNEIILKKLQELGPLPFSVEKHKKGTDLTFPGIGSYL